MRLLIFCFFLVNSINAQINYKSIIAPASLSFVSGAAWGLHETTTHHWDKFQTRFPNANPQFWNPAVSWRNKYNGGNPELGRNGKLIWTSDAKHILASTNQVFIFGAGCTIFIGRKVSWKEYALRVAGSAVGYTIGNSLTYNWLY
jgi:hypothetical protein